MRKIITYCILTTTILSFFSCAKSFSGVVADDTANPIPCGSCSARYTPTETSLIVKNETEKMLYSRVDKMASAETNDYTYYFVINENKTFSVIVNIHGTKQYEFRAGTFQPRGDTLNLNYYKNLKSAYLTDKAVLDNEGKAIFFLGENSGKTTKLKIANRVPRSLIVMLFRKLPDGHDASSREIVSVSVPSN